MDHSLWSSLGYPEKSILDTSRRNIQVDPLSAQPGLELWNPEYFPSADNIINRLGGNIYPTDNIINRLGGNIYPTDIIFKHLTGRCKRTFKDENARFTMVALKGSDRQYVVV